MSKSQYFEWRETVYEEDDLEKVGPGIKVFLRADRTSKGWKLRQWYSETERWEDIPFTTERLEYLREVMWNKYQRRRVPYSFIEELDASLGKPPVKATRQ